MERRRKVLVIEDEQEIARLVEIHLEDLGCTVERAHRGRSGLDRALASGFDLIILDLMLPDVDGIEICRRLRARGSYPPVLMLTARSGEVDRVLGLEVGADDYLTKPFSIRELVARVKAIFRRVEMASASREDADAVVEVADLVLDARKRRVTLADEPVTLTAREFDLLAELVRHPGRVYTRSELLDRVWGYAHDGYEHTVNSHINRLRGKIEADPREPGYVLTVWGVGYKFYDPDEPAGS